MLLYFRYLKYMLLVLQFCFALHTWYHNVILNSLEHGMLKNYQHPNKYKFIMSEIRIMINGRENLLVKQIIIILLARYSAHLVIIIIFILRTLALCFACLTITPSFLISLFVIIFNVPIYNFIYIPKFINQKLT